MTCLASFETLSITGILGFFSSLFCIEQSKMFWNLLILLCSSSDLDFFRSWSRLFKISARFLGLALCFFFNIYFYLFTIQTPTLLMLLTILYYMADPVLGKSLCSDWFFLGQDFAVRAVSVETVQSVYFCFGAKPANLQPRQRKKSVKIVILHIETTSRS